ncbi:MAG: AlpA family phage regulatory protein [Pseudomonadota bacterium]
MNPLSTADQFPARAGLTIDSSVRLLRNPDILEMRGIGRTKLDADVKSRLWPPPVKLGRRCVRWVYAECMAVQKAIIAGCGDDEIRKLVDRLVAARAEELE